MVMGSDGNPGPIKQKATPKDGFMLAQLPDRIGYVVAFGVTPGFLPGAGRGIYPAIRHWKPSTGVPLA